MICEVSGMSIICVYTHIYYYLLHKINILYYLGFLRSTRLFAPTAYWGNCRKTVLDRQFRVHPKLFSKTAQKFTINVNGHNITSRWMFGMKMEMRMLKY